jgi:serine/threonine protein kinase
VDWWALGVLIFEMISGVPPFYDNDQLNTYKKILSGNIEWPSHFGIAVRDLIKRLLQVGCALRRREGCGQHVTLLSLYTVYGCMFLSRRLSELCMPCAPSLARRAARHCHHA